MQVTCPMCSISFPSASGNTQTCPACMHAFELERKDKIPGALSLEVQGPLGEALGRFDLYELRQMIYAGQMTGKEVVREDGGDWEPVYERIELLQIFELMGIDLVAIRLSSQRVQGWRKDSSADEEKKRTSTKKKASLQSPEQNTEKSESEGLDSKKVAAYVAVALILCWVLFSLI